MAGTTFPLAQGGNFSIATSPAASPGPAPAGFCIHEVTPSIFTPRYDTTGTRIVSGTWTQDQAKQYQPGSYRRRWVIDGVVESSSTYDLAQSATFALDDANLKLRVTQLTLSKRWPLDDITNSTDEEYGYAIPIYYVNLRGWVTSTGPGFTTDTEDFTLTSAQLGTIAWSDSASTLNVEQLRFVTRHKRGGNLPVTVSGPITGAPQYSAGANDWTWLFNPTGSYDYPQKVTCTHTTGGENITNSVLMSAVTLSYNLTSGGPVRVQIEMPFDKAAS